jgi:hypothetical protein
MELNLKAADHEWAEEIFEKLKGGSGDTAVPLIYGDYFFTEAVLRLLRKDFLIW